MYVCKTRSLELQHFCSHLWSCIFWSNIINELTKVGSDQRSSMIQYDSKSKHSKRRQTVIRQHARARTVLFLKGIISVRFFRWEVVRHARVLSLCMLAPARAGPPATTAPALSATRRQRRKVDKCRVADKKRTNQQTNKHTLLFYRYR